jgi:hypothetical protein
MNVLDQAAQVYAHLANTARYNSPDTGYVVHGFRADFRYESEDDLLYVSITKENPYSDCCLCFVFNGDDVPCDHIVGDMLRTLINAEIKFHADQLQSLAVNY